MSTSQAEAANLVVEDDIGADVSSVSMNPLIMDKLKILDCDTVMVRGNMKYTVCIAFADYTCEESKIKMNEVVRRNLRVDIGDMIEVDLISDVMNGKKVHILPIKDAVELEEFTGSLFEDYLRPFFHGTYRPVRKGDIYPLRSGTRTIEFKIVDTDPDDYCVVVDGDTEILFEGEPVDRNND